MTLDDGDPAVDDEPPASPPSLLDRGFRRLGQVLALVRTSRRRPTVADADGAEPPEDDGNQAHDTERPRKLTGMGRFRQDFWAHVSKRHPCEATPPGWASSNIRRPVETTGRRFSLYVAQDGVGVFFPRNRDESPRKRAAAVRATVKWLRKKTGDAEMPDNGWSFLKLDSRTKPNWDRWRIGCTSTACCTSARFARPLTRGRGSTDRVSPRDGVARPRGSKVAGSGVVLIVTAGARSGGTTALDVGSGSRRRNGRTPAHPWSTCSRRGRGAGEGRCRRPRGSRVRPRRLARRSMDAGEAVCPGFPA